MDVWIKRISQLASWTIILIDKILIIIHKDCLRIVIITIQFIYPPEVHDIIDSYLLISISKLLILLIRKNAVDNSLPVMIQLVQLFGLLRVLLN